ncbi:cytochrome b5-like heme/steroid binding domain-containing protein [Lipomyces arxii]|uniref:cytochrome b5-like heme/steroid binding domain-containing protein n=1 Tax=Lipomyces arxii TaxID=56418 RepID=UPI0034CF6835
MSEVYTREQVKAHADRDDLWMVIHGKVYDVTKFVDEHPGGEEVLIDAAGVDASDAFEDVGHSDEARKILEELIVGELDPSEIAHAPKSTSTKSTSSSSSGSSAFTPFLLVTALVALAAVVTYLLNDITVPK